MQPSEHAIEFDSRLIQDSGSRSDSVAKTAADAREKSHWVEEQLTRTFIANARTALQASVFALPVTLVMLYGRVSTLILVLWAVMVVYLSIHRYWIITQYRRRHMHARAHVLHQFFERHRWTWPTSSVIWAALLFAYYDKVPADNQLVCILVLVGMGAFSVPLMSARLDCFRPYVDGLSLASLLAVLLAWSRSGNFPGNINDLALAILVGVFWSLLRSSGSRFHAVQRRGYELQFDNERLIASLREQTAAAVEAVQVKDRLLANAAHDLRQPVHALAFYADWLRNEPQMSVDVMPKILQATDSVNTLFNSLFDFAKIEAGGIVPQMQEVRLSEVIHELALQFAPSAQAKSLKLHKRIRDVSVWTDPILIRRIVGNLLANAIRYTDKGGVLLCVRVHDERARIEVWDTGVGIAPEHLPNVFREFYKAPVHQGTEDGFGLGLAIVDRLAKALHHKVNIKSVTGSGTRFRIEMWLSSHQAVHSDAV